eukprot:5849815-Pleurochrysis_carterae.AAC.1
MKLVKEMYFSIMLDRTSMGPLMVACAEGGTSIEDLAHSSPEKIIKARRRTPAHLPPPLPAVAAAAASVAAPAAAVVAASAAVHQRLPSPSAA